MAVLDVFEEQVAIRATPEIILPFLFEVDLLPLWSPTEVIVTKLNRKKPGPGAQLKLEFIEHGLDPIVYEILELTDTELVSSFKGRMSGIDRWTLEPNGRKTNVHNRMEFNAPDPFTLFGWIAAGRSIAIRDIREKMPLLRDTVEESLK